MSFTNITVIHPDPNGTPIYDVSNGVDKKVQIGFSKDWSTRWRAAKAGGCPSWIDQIVVGKNLDVLNKTSVRAAQNVAVASSSKSSRDVVVILLDADGAESNRTVCPYVYVAASHGSGVSDNITGQDIPIADELWFSSKIVDDPIVAKAEADCNHSL
jgi:hypothetical protein